MSSSAQPPAKRTRVDVAYVDVEETDASLVEQARRAVLDTVFGDDEGRKRRFREKLQLPGPLAATLSHRTMTIVDRSNYQVCEKSDGERRMLLTLPAPKVAFFLDRKFTVFRIPEGDMMAALWSFAQPTLLDGELVVREDGSHAYMVFDVVSFDGDMVGRQRLDQRLECIGKKVRVPFRDEVNRRKSSGRPLPPVRCQC